MGLEEIPLELTIDGIGSLRMAIITRKPNGEMAIVQTNGGLSKKDIDRIRSMADVIEFDNDRIDIDTAKQALVQAILNSEAPEIRLKGWRNGMTVGVLNGDQVHWIKLVPWNVIDRIYRYYQRCQVRL